MKAHAVMVGVKLFVLVVALGLDVFWHLDGQLTQLLTVAIGSLGLTTVVTAWRSTAPGGCSRCVALERAAGEYLQNLPTVVAAPSVPPPAPPPVPPAVKPV